MYLAGYTTITNVDYSSVCVESMAQRHADCIGMSWVCMDARRLAFPDSSFDVVIEKGTLDAMLVEERDPWNISHASVQLLHTVLKEVIQSGISVGAGIYCYLILFYLLFIYLLGNRHPKQWLSGCSLCI